MNLNGKQIISIIAAVVSALMLATTQLTDIFGAPVAKLIVSTAALANMILNSIIAAITGQNTLVREVAAMPGVEPLRINANASPALAAMAVNPLENNIDVKPSDREIVEAKAGT